MTCQDCTYLREENHRLAIALTETRSSLEQAQSRITELEKTNAELEHRLKAYENPHTPPSRRVIYPKTRKLTEEPLEGKPRYPGRPRGHRGVTRPRLKPDVVVQPPRVEACTCGARLGEPEAVSGRVVEEIGSPSPHQVIEYLQYSYTCPCCGKHITSTHPDCPPSGRFGKNTIVQTILLRSWDRLPLRRTADSLERTYGLSVTPATVLGITERAAEELRPEVMEMAGRVRESPVVNVDETGLSVDGVRYWVWVFVTLVDVLIVIRESRGKRVLREVLGRGFKGVLVCDGWRSYSCFAEHIQRCWAHILREARYVAERVGEAVPMYEGLKGIYDRLSVWTVDKPPPELASMLVEEARAEVLRLTEGPWSSGEAECFAGKVRNGLDGWFTFLAVPGVEPTNNRAERMLREVVVQRKIVGCLRNEKGTAITETLMSLLLTWNMRGLDLKEELGDALTRQWTKS
jgi:transposase